MDNRDVQKELQDIRDMVISLRGKGPIITTRTGVIATLFLMGSIFILQALVIQHYRILDDSFFYDLCLSLGTGFIGSVATFLAFDSILKRAEEQTKQEQDLIRKLDDLSQYITQNPPRG